MGLFGGGGASVSNTLANNVNPIFSINVGDGNKAETESSAKTDQTSTASNKDEFGMSASVGVGVGGPGSGGPASMQRSGDDVQPNYKGAQTSTPGINPLYIGIGAGAVALVGLVMFLSKKK